MTKERPLPIWGRALSRFSGNFQRSAVQWTMDSNRGKTGQDIADLELAAEKARRELESAYRWVTHCYSMIDRACENSREKERAFDLAQRAVKLARHKVGAVAVAFAAAGLGDPIAALLG